MSNLYDDPTRSQASDRATTPRPVGRPSVRAERRDEIVEAAVEVILEHGIAGATRARIAERAGVRPSALHHFLGTQPAVLRAAIDHMTQLLERSLTGQDGTDGDPRESLVSTVDLAFGQAIDRPEVNRLVDELVAYSYRDAPTATTLAEFYRGICADLTERVELAWPGAHAADARAVAAEIVALAHSAGTFRHLGLVELATAAHQRARSLAEHEPSHGGSVRSPARPHV